jgi:hypothetical protein
MIAMAWKDENVDVAADAHNPKHWPDRFVKYLDSFGRSKML